MDGTNIKQALNSIVEKAVLLIRFSLCNFFGQMWAQETDRQMNHESILSKIIYLFLQQIPD